jgi:uncharacterized membrane protein (Fun14 family)
LLSDYGRVTGAYIGHCVKVSSRAHIPQKEMSSSEVLLFSTGGGFLCGALAGYAIKKILKIGATIVGQNLMNSGWLNYYSHVFDSRN